MVAQGTGPSPRTVAVERLTAGDHACLDFTGDDQRWAARAAFAAAGLVRGERVLICTEAGVDGTVALDRLAAHGLRAERAAKDGRLEFVTEQPGYDPASGFDPDARTGFWSSAYDTALACGFTGLRAAGDMTWAAGHDVSPADLAQYEAGITGLFADLGLTGMCEYDRRVFGPLRANPAAAGHPLSVLPPTEGLLARREGEVLRLVGDADLATREEYELSLREAAGDPGLGVIDITGLAFMGAHCARFLLGIAARGTGRTKLPNSIAIECTAAQYRLLRLCGTDESDGTSDEVDLRIRQVSGHVSREAE